MKKIILFIKNIWPFLWSKEEGKRTLILCSFIATGIASLLTVASPLLLKRIVDALLSPTQGYSSNAIFLTITYGLTWSLTQVLLHIRTVWVRKSCMLSVKNLIYTLIKHLNRLPLSYHYDRKTGDVVSIIQRAEHGFSSFVQGVFWQIIPLTFEITLAIICILKICGLAFGVGVFFILTAYLASLVVSVDKAALYQKQHTIQHAKASSHIVELLLNFEVVRMFHSQDREENKLNNILNQKMQSEYLTIRKMETFGIIQTLILGTGLSILSIMAVFRIQQGLLTPGDFILIVSYLLQFSLPVSYFGYVAREVRISLTNIKDFINILSIPTETEVHQIDTFPPSKEQVIQFKNVTFGYQKDRIILEDISFSLAKGKKLGIVGYSGEGKSTIAKLLLRFFKVSKGDILINGYNINDIAIKSIRTKVGIVPQDIILFNDTLKNNLTYGHNNVSEQELVNAIKLVRLDRLMNKLPDGLNTLVGERGIKLSGGEKQRIALVRTLLKNPELYIFDEATSSLDYATEKSILLDIKRISIGMTSIFISHRLSAVVDADEIIMIANGKIIERGNHNFLLSQNGSYAALWNTQAAACEV
ncbi:MAG TPA: ABC transporter ATP-binding protein [Gammaproteobacteria bacterium]|nr:ABC transporter ATP-binding protein [Gammaproteobacteria bacterium]